MIKEFKLFENDYFEEYKGMFIVKYAENYLANNHTTLQRKLTLMLVSNATYIVKESHYRLTGDEVVLYTTDSIGASPYNPILMIDKDEYTHENFMNVKELYDKYPDDCVAIYDDIIINLTYNDVQSWWIKIISNIKNEFDKIEDLKIRSNAKKYNL